MATELRKVAVIGGARIPFCRSNSIYSEKSNMDMLAAALNGLIQRFNLAGQKLDEVAAGAVMTHSRDWNLAREAALSTSLSPLTPAVTVQQACGTSLQDRHRIGSTHSFRRSLCSPAR
jgi:acetyl-CoA C-acetyltransferase